MDSGTVLVFPIGTELHSISGPDFEVFTVSVAEKTVAGICERFGLAPAAFLKARRLAAAREWLLKADEGGEMVGNAAAALGFWHLGHFAADYRGLFSEALSETLRRSRSR